MHSCCAGFAIKEKKIIRSNALVNKIGDQKTDKKKGDKQRFLGDLLWLHPGAFVCNFRHVNEHKEDHFFSPQDRAFGGVCDPNGFSLRRICLRFPIISRNMRKPVR